MSWNNRIFKHTINGDTFFALHETYYSNDDGKVESWTVKPVTGLCESVDELIMLLENQLDDAKRFREDILEYSDSPNETN